MRIVALKILRVLTRSPFRSGAPDRKKLSGKYLYRPLAGAISPPWPSEDRIRDPSSDFSA